MVPPGSAFGFLGLSYVTFRALDVLFCIRDRLVTTLPPAQYFVYLFFFPTVSAGPVDRFRRFEVDWKHTRSRVEFVQAVPEQPQAIHRPVTNGNSITLFCPGKLILPLLCPT